MSDFKIDVELDDVDINRALNGLLSMGTDLSEMLDVIGGKIETSTKERLLITNIAPDGTPWEPSRRALAEGNRTLVNNKGLLDSIGYEATGDEVVISTNLPYAAIHQFGGVIKPKNAKKLAFKTPFGMAFLDQVTIPARPYFGVSGDDEIEVSSVMQDFLQEAIHGR